MDTRKRLGVAIGAVLTLALILPAVAVAKASGSIRTTSDAACDPQNANTYGSGDWVYLAGKDFAANAALSWTIDGLPGGASADPGVSVAQGAGTTDANGSFCFQAYQVAADDLGVYKATVVQGTTSKSDNFTVQAAPVQDPGSNPGDTGSNPGDTGSNPTDTGSNPTDTGSNPGDTGSNPADTGSNPTDTGSNPGDTGSNPGDTGSNPTDTGAGPEQGLQIPGDTASDPADDTASDPAGDATGPTQQVLGETSGPVTGGDEQLAAETSSGTPQMPATDTIESTSATGPGSILIGLALIAGAAILFAPNRRRVVRA